MNRIVHRLLAAVMLAATALASPWAAAQDLELYEQPEFAGTRLSTTAAMPDLAAYGLGGRVGSVVVRRGQWEFCTQPQFGGTCLAVGPGRYAQLPPALRGSLASARPLGATGVPAQPVAGLAGVVLFEGEFSGPQVALREAVDDLRSRQFNDTATSVDVQGGTWELCTDGGYRGQCLRLGPGRHPLPAEYRRRISSLRPVTVAVAVTGPVSAPAAQPALVLFEHTGHAGRQLALSGATPRLGLLDFNDIASSVEVHRGRWQLCEHADYQGRCTVIGPGRHLLSGPFHDSISSVRPVFGHTDQPLPAHGGVTLYEHVDFNGRTLLRTEATQDLKALGFNDRASAIEVHGGQWELCSDGGYAGQCQVFGPGRHLLGSMLADRLSSLRPR